MRVVVAEKPSVARDLARALGARDRRDGWIEGPGLQITWCIGHVAELEEPAHYDPRWKRWSLEALPMVPERFELRARKAARQQFAVIRRVIVGRHVEEVVNACDAGREGELIFRYVYELAGCTAPVLRLWVSSLTDAAIRGAWKQLQPSARYDRLADAARCRSEADWLVGLNATRAITCRARSAGGGELLSVGRVQTPTLALIVERDRAIEAFVPEPFWQVHATFRAEGPDGPVRWRATWFRRDRDEPRASSPEETPLAERLPSAEQAEAIASAAHDQVGRVAVADRRQKVEKPPLLYDLTSLQRRANQRYGLSAPRTLEVAQVLYERHKLITYPRTDARFLTPDQVPELPGILRGLRPLAVYRPIVDELLAAPIQPGSRVIDASEVGDHHAIVPTGRTPDPGRLSADEKRVFDLIARRLLAALSSDAVFDTTTLVVHVPPAGPLPDAVEPPLSFRARGRVCITQGWRAVDPPPSRTRDRALPLVHGGAAARAGHTEVVEGRTRPPQPFTDASLLKSMEGAGKALDDQALKRALRSRGLGTPATRAAIIQTLIDRGYVGRDGRVLRATPKGSGLVDAVPVVDLKSAELTGRWEGRLTDIVEGRDQRDRFMRDVAEYVGAMVERIASSEPPPAAASAPAEALGACPACSAPVRARGGVYRCDTGRECPFVVFVKMAKRPIRPRLVRQLLKEGRTRSVKGFRSRTGATFEAGLRWDPEARKVAFWFPL